MSRDISPSKEALSNRNLTLLLETLSKKETQKSIEALSKIEKDDWKAMAITVETLNNFVSLGGITAMITTLTSSIKTTIDLQIKSALSPLTNEINQQITDLLNPFLNDVIAPITNDIATFFSENAVGTGVGGIAGGVIGAFLRSPAIGAMIGAAIGAGLEQYYKWVDTIYPDEQISGSIIGFNQWRWENREGISLPSLADYKIWLANQTNLPYQKRYTAGPDDYRGGR